MTRSSGIKRGLAATAISALAVAGIPVLALSFAPAANAAGSDIGGLAYSGPARNGAGAGAIVVLKITPGSVVAANLKVTGTGLGNPGTEDTAAQTIGTLTPGVLIPNGAPADSNATDGLDELPVSVPVTTTVVGSTASYAIFEDEGGALGVDASEPRVQVTTVTSGAPVNVVITPATQTAPVGVASGAYTVTIRDAGSRLTQLTGGETVAISGPGLSDASLDATETTRGTGTFTATGAAKGLANLSAAGATGAVTNTATATLDVVGAANISDAELDIVTGADNSAGFGAGVNPVSIRVDQTSVKLDLKSNNLPVDANSLVQVTATGAGGIKFGGLNSIALTTTLSSAGLGSITVTPDAGTVTDTGSITLSGANFVGKTLNFVRATPSNIVAGATTYLSAFGGSVNVTSTVIDQFGLPVTSGLVTSQRALGVNADAAPTAKKPVGADGTVTFTFTDTKATEVSKASDFVNQCYYVDAVSGAAFGCTFVTQIVYSADGQGADFNITADGLNTAGVAYDPASVSSNPLADAVADNVGGVDEFIALAITGGTAGVPVTVSADNGALVLNTSAVPSQTTLKQGAASRTGALTNAFRIVGTKTGLVNVTVASGGRSKTFAVTVKAPVGPARNIAVSGPAEANSGDLAVFTAMITDAFGNPVSGFPVGLVNVQVSGPGALQDSDAVSSATGALKLNVRLDDDADSPVTVKVTASGAEFGFAADANSAVPNSAPGLTASASTATATIADVTDLAGLQAAVDAAQADVDAANATRNAAIAQLKVAKAQLANAKAALKAEKGDVNRAKRALKRAKASGNRVRIAKAKAALRAEVRDVRAARGDVNVAAAEVNAKQVAVDNATAVLVAALAALAAAQAELDEAQA